MPATHQPFAREPITPEARPRTGTRSRRRHHARSLLAGAFVLCLLLTLALGPGTVNSRHGSYLELTLVSLVSALLMLIARPGLLIPIGVATREP